MSTQDDGLPQCVPKGRDLFPGSEPISSPRHVQIHVDTFARGEMIASALSPLCETVMSVYDEFGSPLRPVTITYEVGGRAAREVKWSLDTLSKMADLWSQRKLSFFAAEFYSPTGEVEINIDSEVGDVSLASIEITSRALARDASEGILQLGSLMASSFYASYGFITYDYGPRQEPRYESLYGINSIGQCVRCVRGYYWANYLTPRHVARLGGRQKLGLDAEAAGLIVDDINQRDDWPVTCVRMPSPLTSFSDDELRSMRDLLDPLILRPELASRQTMYPVRVIEWPTY